MQLPTVIIPAYKPDGGMIELIKSLKEGGFLEIVVVDDGSGEQFNELFLQAAHLGCHVAKHGVNMGKGRALKTAFNYVLVNNLCKNGIVTVDADGQHTVKCAKDVCVGLKNNPNALVIGVRDFANDVPLRSRLGNSITAWIFSAINGAKVTDTQTGLRAMGIDAIKHFVTLDGERYEYEMNMLLYSSRYNIQIVQIPIKTIYIEDNQSSHFNPLRDSIRIYALLFKFVLSSLLSWIIDYSIFTALTVYLPGQLFVAVIGSRACSSLVNYGINKTVVFKDDDPAKATLAKYYILVVIIMLLSYGGIWLLTDALRLNIYFAKIMCDLVLYILSFYLQREFVFNKPKSTK